MAIVTATPIATAIPMVTASALATAELTLAEVTLAEATATRPIRPFMGLPPTGHVVLTGVLIAAHIGDRASFADVSNCSSRCEISCDIEELEWRAPGSPLAVMGEKLDPPAVLVQGDFSKAEAAE